MYFQPKNSQLKISCKEDQNAFLSKKLKEKEGFAEQDSGKTHSIQNKESKKKITTTRLQKWGTKEVQKVFSLYEEYGSQWKLISQQFFDRIPNSIKNRFYTTLRNMLKSLFRAHPKIKKIPHEIASKNLYKFYHSREEFNDMKGLASILLKGMKYGNQNYDAMRVCELYEEEVFKIYSRLFLEQDSENEAHNFHQKILINKKEQKNTTASCCLKPSEKVVEISEKIKEKQLLEFFQRCNYVTAFPCPPYFYFLNYPFTMEIQKEVSHVSNK